MIDPRIGNVKSKKCKPASDRHEEWGVKSLFIYCKAPVASRESVLISRRSVLISRDSFSTSRDETPSRSRETPF